MVNVLTQRNNSKMKGLILFVACVFCVAVNCEVNDYCWKDFKGKIPKDALPGGTDENGDPIYIAQIFNLRKLTIGKIYKDGKEAFYAEEGIEFSVKQNIKILCTSNPDNFEWVKTSNSDILSIRKDLIVGGTDPDYYIYIGKAEWGQEKSIGKVLVLIDRYKKKVYTEAGLHITSEGYAQKFDEFEVLMYKKKIVH